MSTETAFQNARYEYTTREVPTDHVDMVSSAMDREMAAEGWMRAWAEIVTEGTFIVYRRERNPAERRVRRPV